jgi:protein PET117
MHEGVIRDMQNQRNRLERQADFDMQKALEAEYMKEQEVRNTSKG